ncbi:MAG: FHA domain-containing protein [Clostridia bacterium]|nr:FHA domain-containing protein [Clostridia bacterium]MBR6821731.1 FHA domain-containing protein [Clostridia bacterium]
MLNSLYQVLAIGMKYWFIALAAAILWLVISISGKEYRERKTVLSEVGNYIGYLEIVGGMEEEEGTRIGLARENTIGSGHNADIVVRDESIEKMHAHMAFDGNRLMFTPLTKKGTRINGRKAINSYPVRTGDIVQLGNVVFRIFLRPELEELYEQ